MSRLPLDSILVRAKTPDAKTPATDSSARKLKGQKQYIPDDPNSDPNSSDSWLRTYDLSVDHRRHHKRKNN